MESLRVAFLVDKCVPFFVGGYEARIFEIAVRLAKKNEVRVYTSMQEASRQISGVQFLKSAPTTFQRWVSGNRSLVHSLVYSLGTWRSPFGTWVPDAIVVESIPYLQIPIVKRWLTPRTSISVLDVNEAWVDYSGYGGPLGQVANLAIRTCLKSGVDSFRRIVSISRSTAESLARTYPDAKQRIAIITMGIDVDKYSPPSGEEDTEQRTCGPYDVISIGRLVSYKRQADLIRALYLLHAEHSWRGRAVILGDGPDRQRLERLVSDLKLSGQVEIAGFVSEATKIQMLRKSSICVLSSEREGFSLSTLESMGCGAVPVVAEPTKREVFGVGDYVLPGVNGQSYPVGDVLELSNKINSILTDSALRERLSSRSIATARAHSWEAVASQYDSLLRGT